ncbi:hypothetical protein H2203_007983 [Taxawa tesnikishii (nom. ined.)]|nr:hypothetical protein H2203_007983 [Dothideales sp. JES 119]
MSEETVSSIVASSLRTIDNIVVQSVSTHLFGLVSYISLAVMLRRCSYQYQSTTLTICFLFLPWLMSCQLLFGLVCSCRNYSLGARGDIAYHLTGALGMHHKKSKYDDSRFGNLRILDRKPQLFRPVGPKWNWKHASKIFALLFPTVQAAFSCAIAYRRCQMPGKGNYLGIDYRNGWMAFNGGLAALAMLIHLCLGVDWEVDETQASDFRKVYIGDIPDTSNAYIYECMMALFTHQALLTLCHRYAPVYLQTENGHPGNVGIFLTKLLIPIAFGAVVPVALMDNFFVRSVGTQQQANFRRGLRFPRRWARYGAVFARVLLFTTVIGFGVVMPLYADILELKAIAQGETHEWNAGWEQKDVWGEKFPLL